jgi:hypothetical protein
MAVNNFTLQNLALARYKVHMQDECTLSLPPEPIPNLPTIIEI